jgi:hypothetical protein
LAELRLRLRDNGQVARSQASNEELRIGQTRSPKVVLKIVGLRLETAPRRRFAEAFGSTSLNGLDTLGEA